MVNERGFQAEGFRAWTGTFLCVRKLIEASESDKPNLAKQYFVDKTSRETVFVLERIDGR